MLMYVPIVYGFLPEIYVFVRILITDINECENNNGRCEQICVNSEGAYECVCNVGYRLSHDGRRCIKGTGIVPVLATRGLKTIGQIQGYGLVLSVYLRCVVRVICLGNTLW